MDLKTFIRDVYRDTSRTPPEPFTTARMRFSLQLGISQGVLVRACNGKRIHRGSAVAISAATIGPDGQPRVSVDELVDSQRVDDETTSDEPDEPSDDAPPREPVSESAAR